MYRRFAALFFLLFCVLTTVAQVKNYTLKGYMGVQGGESFSYRLEISDSAGNIKGHSLTYLTEGKEVKAWITGTVDRKNKTLSFRETSIVHNNGFESSAILCLVDAFLKYVPASKGYVLEGPITSKDLSNADCSRGSINFVNDDVLKELFGNTTPVAAAPAKQPEVQKAPAKTTPMMVVYDTVRRNSSVSSQRQPDRITANVEKVYEWNTDTVVIDVWDGSNIDGDVLSINYNDKNVLGHYRLKEEKMRLRIPLSGNGTDVITITAEEEGNEPPNTASLLLTDGNKSYPVIAYNDRGRQAVIRIRKAAKK